jgi:glycosyltransferase involved in cell wall biosynthesis
MENVSVVLSFYNNEKTIVESIQSVLNQTYKKIELILIDDGSVDQSNYLIKKNFKKKKNIKIFKNKQNQGLAYSLNKAIKKTNSNLIFRMDADDISKKDRISKQVSFMNKNPKTPPSYSLPIFFYQSYQKHKL